jgi:hypothetical protein
MISELPTLFDATGREAPPSTVDLDAAIAIGRRARSRHQVLVGAAAATSVAAVVAGTVALSSAVLAAPGGVSTTPGAGADPSVTTSVSSSVSSAAAALDQRSTGPTTPPLSVSVTASPPASSASSSALQANGSNPKGGGEPPSAVAAVSLPDPAPGFPLRRWDDDVEQATIGAGGAPAWVATFGLGVRPDIPTRDSSGRVIGGTPDGSQVTILVGDFELPALSGLTIEGNEVVARPAVAGTSGYVTRYTEKGTVMSTLYFSSGHLSVEIFGYDNVSTNQLVALGNALTGLS